MDQPILRELDTSSEKAYTRSVWWIDHRAMIGRRLFLLWGIVVALLVGFASWLFVDAFLLFPPDQEQTALVRLIVGGSQTERHQASLHAMPKPFAFGPVIVLPAQNGAYDFYTTITNPNPEWYATFRYAFISGSGTTGEQETFILPAEEKPLLFLGHAATRKPEQVEIRLSAIEWQGVAGKERSSYKAWRDARIQFDLRDIAFTKDITVQAKTLGQVSFTAVNQTAYSYYEPGFFVILRRGQSVAGVSYLTTRQFRAGEERRLGYQWLGTLPAVSKIEVIPNVNIFDPAVYMPPEAAPTSSSQ